MMYSQSFALTFLLPLVAAHGWLDSVAIDGKVFKGDVPNSGANDSAIRLVDSVDPVKGATTREMNCGQNAQIAPVIADANPGSNLTFTWINGEGGTWVHNTGPMLTYLASCGNTSCDQFDAINAQWFKVDQVGQKPDGSGTWFMADIAAGTPYTMTLPSNLAAGGYLVRHELIALQIAQTEGGAEFYPSCTQINVGGNETGTPNTSDLVSFPGAYSDTDPGILVNAYDASLEYQFPGPAIVNLTSTASSENATSTTKTGTSGSCVASSGSSDVISSFAVTQTISLRSPVETTTRPYRISRIMRDITNEHA